jgi:hypothetical protein
LWASLLAAGRAVDVVVVGRNAERLPAAGRVLDGWVATPAASEARYEIVAAELTERARRCDAPCDPSRLMLLHRKATASPSAQV